MIAKRELDSGTTSCGPACVVISGSVESVLIWKSSGDVAEEPLVLPGSRDAGLGRVEAVELGLELVPAVEEGLVVLTVSVHQVRQRPPEGVLVDPAAGECFSRDEVGKRGCDAEVGEGYAVGHRQES